MRNLCLLLVLLLCGTLVPILEAQVTCTPSVPSSMCKQFDLNFGPTSLWPTVNYTKGIEIVIVDPSQFKVERAKWDKKKDMADKSAKSVREINRVAALEAGDGVFDHEILECPSSSMVERIVISTEAVDDAHPISQFGELSDQLLFYVIGYDQGLVHGLANAVP
jgi:hypothetical protein